MEAARDGAASVDYVFLMHTGTVPSDFFFGVSTAGHQVEGDNSNSDTWFLENVEPTVFREPSGKACNSLELWETDLDIVQGLGLEAYRFSVEWARIEPTPGTFDSRSLAHYDAMVDGCLARGLAPVVTFNHFTAPHWFAAAGGFLAADAAERFGRYCAVVAETIGDRLSHAVTLNEPNLCQLLSWLNLPPFVRELEGKTLEAAAAAADVDWYRVGNVVTPEDFAATQEGFTAGHLAAKAAIKAHRSDLPVGLSIAIVDDVAVGDDTSVRDRKRAEVYEHWLDLAKGDDFIGVQNYERRRYDADGEVEPDAGLPRNEMGSAIEPGSLAAAVRYTYEMAGVPVLVSEHGVATADDRLRAAVLEPALDALVGAMDDGVPVIGYMHWTLMDNFEWIFGYSKQLGLFEVDRDTFARTPKPSAHVYAEIVSRVRAK
ncbi:MAG: family 1 glycosylhydrolase [Acidimicrobiales bacterium]